MRAFASIKRALLRGADLFFRGATDLLLGTLHIEDDKAPPRIRARGFVLLICILASVGLAIPGTRTDTWRYLTRVLPFAQGDGQPLELRPTAFYAPVTLLIAILGLVPTIRGVLGEWTLRTLASAASAASRGAASLSAQRTTTSTIGFVTLMLFVGSLLARTMLWSEFRRQQALRHATEAHVFAAAGNTSKYRATQPTTTLSLPATTLVEWLVAQSLPSTACVEALQSDYQDFTALPELIACDAPNCDACAFRLGLRARFALEEAHQGLNIGNTIAAEKILKEIKTDARPPELQALVSNALGTCMAQYIQNYALLSARYRFAIDDLPQLDSSNPSAPPLEQLVLASMNYYAKAYSAAARLQPQTAKGKLRNNISDLLYRIMRNYQSQCGGITRSVDEQCMHKRLYVLFNAIAPPLTWPAPVKGIYATERQLALQSLYEYVSTRADDLVRLYKETEVPELLLTAVQFKCLQVEMLRGKDALQADAPSPPEVRQVLGEAVDLCVMAALAGFEAPEFYENPPYMGICELFRDNEANKELQERLKRYGISLPTQQAQCQ